MDWNNIVKLHTHITIQKHFSWPPPWYLIPQKNIQRKAYILSRSMTIYIQGVTRGTDQTSGECSLC